VAVELAEIDIHHRRVEKRRQPFRQRHRQTVTGDVEIVQMILETDQRRFDLVRVVDAGHNPTAFLFGCEPLYQHVNAGGHKQLARLFVAHDGVRLARLLPWPMHESAVEVAGINQRHGVAFGLLPQKFFGPKVNDSPGGNGQVQFRQRR
jgi:hypothetical protein